MQRERPPAPFRRHTVSVPCGDRRPLQPTTPCDRRGGTTCSSPAGVAVRCNGRIAVRVPLDEKVSEPSGDGGPLRRGNDLTRAIAFWTFQSPAGIAVRCNDVLVVEDDATLRFQSPAGIAVRCN